MSGIFDEVEHKHRDGTPWYDAPIPPRWHKCRVQTTGWVGFTCVLRCACGAISEYRGHDHYVWDERNSRRATKPQQSVNTKAAAAVASVALLAMATALIVSALAVSEAAVPTLITGMLLSTGSLIAVIWSVRPRRGEQ